MGKIEVLLYCVGVIILCLIPIAIAIHIKTIFMKSIIRRAIEEEKNESKKK